MAIASDSSGTVVSTVVGNGIATVTIDITSTASPQRHIR